MSLDSYDIAINEAVDKWREELTKHFDASIIFLMGALHDPMLPEFRDFIEAERREEQKDRLLLVLNTPGGTAEAVEKMVEIMRHHYREVYFAVPHQAMSAGTILCMSGDKIFMDYSSSLGPIDPQVPDREEKFLIPAMGYLEQVKKIIDRGPDVGVAELAMIQDIDLGMLDAYEKARTLTTTLLKRWLVRYKFQNWTVHRTHPTKKGQPVTPEEKEECANRIAEQLSNNGIWQSHGRYIGVKTLQEELRLEIEDYSGNSTLTNMFRGYHDLLVEYGRGKKKAYLMHGKCAINMVKGGRP